MVCLPDFEQARRLARDYRTIPVWRSLAVGKLDAVAPFRILKNLSRQCFILESLEDSRRWGVILFL